MFTCSLLIVTLFVNCTEGFHQKPTIFKQILKHDLWSELDFLDQSGKGLSCLFHTSKRTAADDSTDIHLICIFSVHIFYSLSSCLICGCCSVASLTKVLFRMILLWVASSVELLKAVIMSKVLIKVTYWRLNSILPTTTQGHKWLRLHKTRAKLLGQPERVIRD